MDDSLFAVLALLPKPVGPVMSNEATTLDGDGVILLFRATDHVPVGIWFVRKVLAPVSNFEFLFLSNVLVGSLMSVTMGNRITLHSFRGGKILILWRLL